MVISNTNAASSLAGMLEGSFARHADRIALCSDAFFLTYSHLDLITKYYSEFLNSKCANDGPGILLVSDRIQCIIWSVAIIRSGRSLCPLETAFAPKMISGIVEQFDKPIIITDAADEKEISRLSRPGATVVRTGDFAVPENPVLSTGNFISAECAYMICSSGSTGSAKLISVSQDAIVSYVRWQVKELQMTSEDRFTHLTPISFDFAFKEWLVPLTAGSQVCIDSPEMRFNGGLLRKWIHRMRISFCCCMPFAFRQLVNASIPSASVDRGPNFFANLRWIMISGEVLPSRLVVAWQQLVGPVPALMNLYGPTESTVIKLYWRIPFPYLPEGDSVPLGRPVSGTAVEIVDESGNPVPDGLSGQITIASDSLCSGYQNNPVATARKIIRTGRERSPYARTLLTGDMGRINKNGEVVYEGRMDFVVKRLGVRIELDSIEAALFAISGISNAAVIAKNDPVSIMAYVVREKSRILSERMVTEELKKVVPPNHLPDHIIFLDGLPKLVNGKTNRVELTVRTDYVCSIDRVTDESEVKNIVFESWKQVLKADQISHDSNFFSLGGDSSKLIEVLGRIRSNGIHLKAIDIFSNPTIGGLCEVIKVKLRTGNNNENQVHHKI